MTYLEGQIACIQAHILQWHAIIVSGAYKHRKVETKDGSGGWRPLTEAELLDDATAILRRHVENLHEFTEALAKQNEVTP